MEQSNRRTIEERILAMSKARKDFKPITPKKSYHSISPKDVSRARRKYFSLKKVGVDVVTRAQQIMNAREYLLNEYNGEELYQNNQ